MPLFIEFRLFGAAPLIYQHLKKIFTHRIFHIKKQPLFGAGFEIKSGVKHSQAKNLVMKNVSFCFLLAILLSCSNGDKSSTTESAPNTPNIQNVNGDVPDTSSSVTLNHTMAQDSSYAKDSTKK